MCCYRAKGLRRNLSQDLLRLPLVNPTAPFWGLTVGCPWPWDISQKPHSILWCCREVLFLMCFLMFSEWCPWPLCSLCWLRSCLWGEPFDAFSSWQQHWVHSFISFCLIVTGRCKPIVVFTGCKSMVSSFHPGPVFPLPLCSLESCQGHGERPRGLIWLNINR